MFAGERKYQMSNEKCAASRCENFASNESARCLFSLALLAQLKIILCHTLYSECTFLYLYSLHSTGASATGSKVRVIHHYNPLVLSNEIIKGTTHLIGVTYRHPRFSVYSNHYYLVDLIVNHYSSFVESFIWGFNIHELPREYIRIDYGHCTTIFFSCTIVKI